MARKAEYINPPNTLRTKLAGPTFNMAEMVARAEKAVDGLKGEFDNWLTDDIAALDQTMKQFSTARTKAEAGALFRAAFDLRGQATTFGFPFIARIAKSLAHLVDGITANDTARETVSLALLTAHIDAIHVIHRDQIKDEANIMATVLAEELEGRVLQTLARLNA